MAKKKAAKKTKDGPLPLIALEVENVLRLKSVNLKMVGDVLVIEGGNEQGKSSLLRVVDILLAGKEAKVAPEPLRGDAKKGHIVGTFGDYVVRKAFSQGKSPILTVKSKTKGALTSPQTILSGFLNHISLDISKFMQMNDREKLATLSGVMGFDSSAFDAEHERLYDERKDANREVKRLRIEMEACPCDEMSPKEEVSIAVLMEELGKRQDHNAGITRLQDSSAQHGSDLAIQRRHSEQLVKQIVRLREELEEAEKTLADSDTVIKDCMASMEEIDKHLAECTLADETAITDEIANADAINAAVRAKAKRAELSEALIDAETKADDFDGALTEVEAAREKARLAARENLPLEDLDITEDAVLYKGKPLSQAGGSAQLRVSVAVAMGLNRDKRIKLLLIDDAEKLDAANTKMVLKMAADAGFQVLMTRVGTGSEGSVVIEDGKLKTE